MNAYPTAIAVDATRVYWTDANAAGSVMTCPIAGCAGAPTTLASGQNMSGGSGIAVDATSVYWTSYEDGTVMKVAKP